MADKNLNINIVAKDKSKQALNNVQGSLNKTKTSVLNLRNALIGIGAGAILKSFIDVGKEVENLQVRFKFLFGSVKEGQIAFDNLSKFASRVPFSLEEITAASGNLAVVSKDANDLTRILEITGNVAAVTGLDFATAGSQIQRAFSGGIAAADIFREKGVRSLLGFKEASKSLDENSESLSKNQELARAMQQFAIRNSEIMKTINHAEIERMKKLDEEVERAFKRQEARNKRKVQLEKDAQREIVSATETGLSALSGLNKTAFRAYQAFQAGMTIINTYRAISNALATYPPPLNLAVAAAQGAAGFAQVAAIRSQSFSARQTGGAVVEGQPYMVGEAGREMFVPSTNGNIVPNDKLGGGSTTVNFNITTVDAKGFNELLTNSRGTIVGMINSAVNEQGRTSLV